MYFYVMYEYDLSLVFLILGYIAFLYVAKLQKYRHMLTANVLSCWLVAIYLIINDAHTGAIVSFIAGLASILQIFLSKNSILGTLKVRNAVGIIMATIAVSILYQKPSDILPCIAFTQNRILEAQGSVQSIRLAVFIGTMLWAYYAFEQSLYLMALFEISVSLYALYRLIKHSKTLQSAHLRYSVAKPIKFP